VIRSFAKLNPRLGTPTPATSSATTSSKQGDPPARAVGAERMPPGGRRTRSCSRSGCCSTTSGARTPGPARAGRGRGTGRVHARPPGGSRPRERRRQPRALPPSLVGPGRWSRARARAARTLAEREPRDGPGTTVFEPAGVGGGAEGAFRGVADAVAIRCAPLALPLLSARRNGGCHFRTSGDRAAAAVGPRDAAPAERRPSSGSARGSGPSRPRSGDGGPGGRYARGSSPSRQPSDLAPRPTRRPRPSSARARRGGQRYRRRGRSDR
jgi:hypothetical protein